MGVRDTSRIVGGFEDRFADLAALSYKVAFRLTGDRTVAEDLCQEALARAYGSWRRIGGYDEAWVARVTSNLAIGRWRKDRRLVPGSAGDRPGPHGPALRVVEEPVDPAVRLELVAALRALPRRQRQVVALRYLADLPEAAVADALGCSAGTVKQHAHRGLASLRKRLGHLDHGPPIDPQEGPDVRTAR
jgi:RNA polymerase sigma-70 factor (sigma-E family)